MALLMGIDTGGTYSDCVLLDEEKGVIASAKALTTRHDLALGIGAAVDQVLAQSTEDPHDIALVSLSTTLATNAVVEGQGGRVCLILIGFDDSALSRAGLAQALKGDPHVAISGGHDAFGNELAPLDLEALHARLEELDGEVSAFAVAGRFAVRNLDHESAVRDLIVKKTGKPVSCSHELSQKLDGPRRALTCVLNARLINVIHHLIEAASSHFQKLGIEAPVMVVRGDGALISADVARLKPIETILSGPAASLVGAAWLSKTENALISDIGGTTTDYAFLRAGRPSIDPEGATVGVWKTMVEAVAMRTIGLGGDSEVRVVPVGLKSELQLGPRRNIPLSLLAAEHPETVHDTLDKQLKAPRHEEHFGLFARAVGRASAHDGALSQSEQALMEELGGDTHPLTQLLISRKLIGALGKLVDRGLVLIGGVTPTDAAHVAGHHSEWDSDAALKALTLFARQKTNAGIYVAENAKAAAGWIIETLVQRSAETLLAACLHEDGVKGEAVPALLLDQHEKSDDGRLVKIGFDLSMPLVGLGAPAATYYPKVAEKLATRSVIPPHSEVANAVGAVVGHVQVTLTAEISQPEVGRYQVVAAHRHGAPGLFTSLEKAIEFARDVLKEEAIAQARDAGAGEVKVTEKRIDKTADVEGKQTLVESVLRLTASGRPRLADGP